MPPPRFGLLSHLPVSNLGDAIQSLAARQYLPRVDIRIPREQIAQPPPGDEPVRLIANGWFMHAPEQWPPHERIDPLLVSMHFAESDARRFQRWRARPVDRLLCGPGADYLRRWGPVGARDSGTFDHLRVAGIPAHLSGCLTMTLQRPEHLSREDFVVACDLSPAHLAHLQRRTRRRVVVTSHAPTQPRNPTEQEAAAEAALDLYARAAAVVTTRVHAALPCLGLGTPVLLIEGIVRERRVSDMTAFVQSCHGYDFLRDRDGFDADEPPPNPETFRPLAERLAKSCRDFVNRP